MSSIPWYLTAVGAALVWGLHYPLIQQALRRVSLATVLASTTVPFVLALSLLWDLIGETCAAWEPLAGATDCRSCCCR